MKVNIISTSMNSAQGEDIILREKSTTRLLFRPMITNNVHNQEASVRGWFVYQRKRPSGNWEDYKELDNSQLKADEWIKLEIKSEELLRLMTELDVFYKIHREYGIQIGERTFSKTDIQLEKITAMMRDNSELFETLLELDDHKSNLLNKTIKWMTDTDNSEEIVTKLLETQHEELDQLNNILGITKLKKLLTIWEDNKENADEEFWQGTLRENAWVLSQVFASPTLLFQEKAYIGGKGLDNRGGKVIDFIYQNELSKEVALIEIKTPATELLSSEYRAGAYSIHPHLTGSIVQALSYKEQLIREYSSLGQNSGSDFNVFSPHCVVIAGNISNLEDNKLQSFELYRKEMKNVVIITFDELFKKVQLLLDLLAEKKVGH